MFHADIPPATLDILEAQRDARGAAPALLAPDRETLTFAALHALIDNAGDTLAALGFARGHRIAVALSDGPDAALAILAAMTWTSCAPLDPRIDFGTCAMLLADARIEAVVTADGDDSPVTRAAIDAGLAILTVAIGRDRRADLFAWRSGSRRPRLARVRPQPDDIALVLHTSGTTARPKIVPLTHAALFSGLGARSVRPDDHSTLSFASSGRFS